MKKPAAKTTVAVHKKQEVEVAGRLSLRERMERDAGRGVSTSADDNVVPIIRLLQDMSPQVKKNNPAYIKGAEPGDIWLKDNPLGPVLVKGSVGFLFQPCAFSKDVVEWRPRDGGGGYVRRWDNLPSDAVAHVDEKTGRAFYTRPNGNELVDTRYHPGFVVNEKTGEASPWVLPMKGSNHAVSRSWMPLMTSKRGPKGKIAPVWTTFWRIKSKSKVNAAGQDFFIYDVEEVREIDLDSPEGEIEYDRGEAMNTVFKAGAKEIEIEVINEASSAQVTDDQSM